MLPKPYHQEASVTIYHGDCRQIIPHLGQFDLVLTDPPYGTEDCGGGYGRRQNHSPDGRLGRTIHGDKDLAVAATGLALGRSRIETGYVVSFCAPRRMNEIFPLVPAAEYFAELIWDKGTPGLGYTVRYTHESALIWRIGEPAKPENALLSVVRQQVSNINTQARHPHEKPVSFWTNALKLPGLRVLDPFAGSGVVGQACKALGRECVLIERDEKYCEMSARRLEQDVLRMDFRASEALTSAALDL